MFAACETDPVATTSVGRFAGRHREGVLEFLGIRYGAAPVGALRFRPPVPTGYVAGVQPAKAFAPAPPQPPDIEEQASTAPQSEDCLFLNVFTPSLSGHRPVLVFIHGGGWTNGGTVDPWYDGAHLAQRGDIVVVTVGYRLGPLGFLDLSAIGGPDYAGSGNLGILDQRLALGWVRDHVADFGGDPDQITICGESAGAQSVAVHLALPDSRALFRRVIAESGALSLLHSQASARATTEQFVKLAGVSDVAGLLALSQAQILDAENRLVQSTSFSDLLFGPVIDGVVVPEPPLHAIARGDAAGIPLLTGTTHDETKYWYFYDDWLAGVAPRDGAKLLPFVSDLFDGPALEALIEGYEARSPTASPGDITMQLVIWTRFSWTRNWRRLDVQGERFEERQQAGQGGGRIAWRREALDGDEEAGGRVAYPSWRAAGGAVARARRRDLPAGAVARPGARRARASAA
jgi:para-nitrobenzyl esterase